MDNQHDPVAAPYKTDDLLNRVLSALRKTHGSLGRLTPNDLAPVDSFHIRGRASTAELAKRAGISSRWRILDVGSGPGGTARFLAAEYGCQVTGLDLTAEYVSLAKRLSEIVGLAKATQFEQGNALFMPFGAENFDCIWMEHLQMNIADKSKLVLEIHRVLKAEGRLVMHEVFKGDAGEPHLPVPWSEDTSTSFMITPAKMRQILLAQGFEIIEWIDVTDSAREWFRSVQNRIVKSGLRPVGIHLLMGLNAEEKMANVNRNLQERRIKLIQALMKKPKYI